MRRAFACMLLVTAIALGFFGCGAKQESGETASSQPPAATTPAATTPAATPDTTAAVTLPAHLDKGPRAGSSPVDAALAAAGEKLFMTRGCTVCHGFGKKITCPDLVGVSMRRTAKWMESQILHPDVMVVRDSISKQLRTQYPLPMTNLALKPEEARSVIEFLKRKDREAGVKPAGN